MPLEALFREAVERCNAAVIGRAPRARRCGDVFASTRRGAALVYLDPPYAPARDDTCYVKRYHFLEGLATYWRGQEIMWETRTRKLAKRHTPFGSKRTVRDALDRLFEHFDAPHGARRLLRLQRRPRRDELEALLARHRRTVRRIEIPHRYAFGTHRAATRRARPSTCSSPSGPILRQVQEMVIYGVSFDMVGKQPIVLLKAVDTNKFLPIWIGHPEAAAILMKLQGASTPRPMTHDLLFDMLGELEVACTRVSVTELRENTFYASITLSVNGREVEIDSRPSDALALAVRSGAPIFAAEDVIAESAIEFEHEVEDTEEVVDKFKEFLDRVTPEDFAGGDYLGRRCARPRGRARAPRTASKPMPAASAASGSSDVSVRPGIALASSTVSSSPASIRSTRANPAQPSVFQVASASSWARAVTLRRAGRPGRRSACAPIS